MVRCVSNAHDTPVTMNQYCRLQKSTQIILDKSDSNSPLTKVRVDQKDVKFKTDKEILCKLTRCDKSTGALPAIKLEATAIGITARWLLEINLNV